MAEMIENVVDSREFAELLGIKPKTVINYLSRETRSKWPKLGQLGSFPKPVAYVANRFPVWSQDDAKSYAENRVGPGWHQKGDERVARYIVAERQAAADAEPAGDAALDPFAV